MDKNSRLLEREGGFSNYVSFLIILPILLAVIVGGSYVAKSLQMMSTLNHALTLVDSNMTQDGALTTNGQNQLISYLKGNQLDLSKVYLNATTTPQSYGSRGLEATLGYDFDLFAPGTSQVVWHKYYQVSMPMAQSQLIPGSGADSSGSVALSSVFAGIQGGTSSGGSSSNSTPINQATSMTLQVSNTSPVVNAPVIASGKVYFGSTPAPIGTQVSLKGGGITQTVSTDSSGAFTASVSLSQPGTVQLQGTSGAATANVSVSVQSSVPGTISLQIVNTTVIGQLFTIAGTVVDNAGNPVMDGTVVTLSSSDGADIPTTTVTTQAGNFTYTVANGVTSLNPVSITASAGSVSATQNVTILPSEPKSISLNLSSTSLVAGSTITFSGQVLGPYGTPPTQGTPVTIVSGTDVADTLPALTTDANGNFSGTATLTLAGNQAFYAQTTGPIISPTTTATVTAGPPYKIQSIVGTPNPVNMGANMAVSGYVSDEYNNPVASGASLAITSSALPATVSTSVLSGAFNARVTLQTPGIQTLSIKDGAGNLLAGGSLSVNVLPTAAYSLTPSQGLYSVIAGQSVSNVVFTLKDSNGQPVAGKTIQFAETPQGNTMLTPASAVTNVSGQVQTTVGPLTSAGGATLTATLAGDSSVVGTVGMTVSSGASMQIVGAKISPSQVPVDTNAIITGTVEDQYGNYESSGTVTVAQTNLSMSASGTVQPNGSFIITPYMQNSGICNTFTLEDGSATATVGPLTSFPKAATLKLTLCNGTSIFDANSWSYFQASVVDGSGNAIQGVQISFTSSAGGNVSWNPEWGTTDQNGNVWQWLDFNSSAVGNRTITASATVNGQTLTASINVYVTNPILTNITWGTVTPTTVQAGNPISISGKALDMTGNPVVNSQIQLYFKEGGAGVKTVSTDGNGNFSTTLTPTITGTKTLVAQGANSFVQYPTPLTVTPGPPASGSISFSYTPPLLTNDTFTTTVNIKDIEGNNVPNYPVTINATSPTGSFNNVATYHPAYCTDGGTIISNWYYSYCSTGTLMPGYYTYAYPQTINTDSNGNAVVTMTTNANAGTITITATAGTVNLSNNIYVDLAVPVAGNVTGFTPTGFGQGTVNFNTFDQKGRPITIEGTLSGSASVPNNQWGESTYTLYVTNSLWGTGGQLAYGYYYGGNQRTYTPQLANSGTIQVSLSTGTSCSVYNGSSSSWGYSEGVSLTWVYGSLTLSTSIAWPCYAY